jgi:hypothetical protein
MRAKASCVVFSSRHKRLEHACGGFDDFLLWQDPRCGCSTSILLLAEVRVVLLDGFDEGIVSVDIHILFFITPSSLVSSASMSMSTSASASASASASEY